MATKVFNARLQNKYDGYQAWYDANPVLLAGEPCFVTVPAETGAVNQEPAVLVKVGDGTTAWRDLPYVSALAADVHDWALAATKPSYKAGEIEGLSDYISGEIQDTNTQYKIEQDETDAHILRMYSKDIDGDWTLTATITTADTVYDDTALVARVAALEGLVGTVAVSTQIDEKIAALKLDETYEKVGVAATEAGKVQTALDEYKTANDAAVKSVADAAKAAQDDVDALEKVVGTPAEGKTIVEMISDAQAAATYDDTKVKEDIAANAEAAADAMAEAQAKVASVTAGDNSVTVGGTATAPTVAAKLSQDADNALELAEDGLKVVIPAAAEYSIVKAENSGDFAAIYNLTKDGAVVGASINIPKDMVVESGSVVENPEGQAEGTYIKLVLQNVAEPLFINVGSLIEYVTSGSAADDMVVVSVSDDHKVTAAITDGSITLAKLSTEIQTAIGKAHSHENADVINGITADDVANWNGAQAAAEATAAAALSAAKTELEGKITAEAERAAAAEDANSKAAAAAKSAADAAQSDVDALEQVHADDKAALEKAISDGDAATLASANEHANDLNTAMNTRVEALEAIDHEHANAGVLDGITAEKVAAWDSAQANAEATAAAALEAAVADLDADIALKANDADLAAVAKTGNVNDLVQAEDDYFILYCGNATTLTSAPVTE